MGSCSNTDIDPTYQYQYNNTQNIKFLPVDTNLSSSDKKNLSYGKEISMQPLPHNILTQDSSPRIIYPNLVTCLFRLNTGMLWPRIVYPGKTWLKGEELISNQNFSSTYQA